MDETVYGLFDDGIYFLKFKTSIQIKHSLIPLIFIKDVVGFDWFVGTKYIYAFQKYHIFIINTKLAIKRKILSSENEIYLMKVFPNLGFNIYNK